MHHDKCENKNSTFLNNKIFSVTSETFCCSFIFIRISSFFNEKQKKKLLRKLTWLFLTSIKNKIFDKNIP